eukprot:4561305-Pleurochrysis_carterae.AAC.1
MKTSRRVCSLPGVARRCKGASKAVRAIVHEWTPAHEREQCSVSIVVCVCVDLHPHSHLHMSFSASLCVRMRRRTRASARVLAFVPARACLCTHAYLFVYPRVPVCVPARA